MHISLDRSRVAGFVAGFCLLAAASPAGSWQINYVGNLTGSNVNAITGVAALPDGDVIGAGYLNDVSGTCGSETDWFVARYDSDTGEPDWTMTFTGGSTPDIGIDLGQHVVVDSNGDVIVAGSILLADGTANRGGVAKIDGLTGAMIWGTYQGFESGSTCDAGNSGVRQLAIGPDDHPVAAFYDYNIDNELEHRIVKLDSASGDLIWEHARPGEGLPPEMHVDGSNDVLAAGYIGGVGGFAAMKLLSSDGSTIWAKDLQPGDLPGGVFPEVRDSSVDAADNLIVGGQGNAPDGPDSAVLRRKGEWGRR